MKTNLVLTVLLVILGLAFAWLDGHETGATETRAFYRSLAQERAPENPAPQTAPQMKVPESAVSHRPEKSRVLGRYTPQQLDIMERAVADHHHLGGGGVLSLELLAAIGLSEGLKAPHYFGIMNAKAVGFEGQARWCAATIAKNGVRYCNARGVRVVTDKQDFIQFLGSRYAPIGADNDPRGLNKNWVRNVSSLYLAAVNE